MPDASPQQSLFTIVVFAFFIALIVTTVGVFWWKSSRTMPVVDGFTYTSSMIENLQKPMGMGMAKGMEKEILEKAIMGMGMEKEKAGIHNQVEGFYAGPAVGAGAPDCMRSSKDASALYEMLSSRKNSTEEGPDDLREMKVILSKISCFKRDLTGGAGVVEATRYQPFATSHDLEPVAETTARCFARTIPQRDLSLTLDKWGSRGTFLIKRLCTSEKLTEAEESDALQLFGDAMADITEIALGKCCNSDVGIIAGQPQPRMVGGY